MGNSEWNGTCSSTWEVKLLRAIVEKVERKNELMKIVMINEMS